jgi:hypothetical protein
VLFRNPGDSSAQSVLVELNRLASELDGALGMTLGFFANRIRESQAQQNLERMRQEHEELGLDLPGGFDASPNQKIFRSLHANVGNPSLIVFDREGRFAWYIMNPRDMDREILSRVVQRLVQS